MFYWYEIEGRNKNLSHLSSTISSKVFTIKSQYDSDFDWGYLGTQGYHWEYEIILIQ